jgi:hypothetical protein
MNRSDAVQATVQSLLRLIHGGEIAVPDFQEISKDNPEQTRRFIVKLAQKKTPQELVFIKRQIAQLDAKAFAGAPTLNGNASVDSLVLDGCTRLNSLYRAFYGKGEFSYVVDLKKLAETGDLENSLQHQALGSMNLGNMAEKMLFPLSEAVRPRNFDEWMNAVKDRRAHGSTDSKTIESLASAYKQWVEPVLNYSFSILTLPSLPLF